MVKLLICFNIFQGEERIAKCACKQTKCLFLLRQMLVLCGSGGINNLDSGLNHRSSLR